MMSELSPLRVRGILSGIATTVNWSSAAFVTGIFPTYQNGVGHYGSWWTLTAITLLSIPFVLVFLPETKGRSLEQIEWKLKGKREDSGIPLLGGSNRINQHYST
jgi:facilitated trehalose transporter